MSDINARSDLRSRLARIWETQTEKPRPLIFLVSPGKEHGDDFRQAADALGVHYIRLHLQQVVTPDQHGLFTQDKPRLVVISGIDQLTPGERDAMVRLIQNGPRTLAVILCQVEADTARNIMSAWRKLRAIEEAQALRAADTGKGTNAAANRVASGAVA